MHSSNRVCPKQKSQSFSQICFSPSINSRVITDCPFPLLFTSNPEPSHFVSNFFTLISIPCLSSPLLTWLDLSLFLSWIIENHISFISASIFVILQFILPTAVGVIFIKWKIGKITPLLKNLQVFPQIDGESPSSLAEYSRPHWSGTCLLSRMSFADCCAYFSSIQPLKLSRAAPYAWNVPLLFLTGKYFSFLGSNQDFPPPHSIMTSFFPLLRFILLFKIFIPLISYSNI